MMWFGFWLMGCSNPPCVPNETQVCLCPGGVSGAQVCASDQQGWEPCICEGDDDSDDDVDEGDDRDSEGDTDSGEHTGDDGGGANLYVAHCASCHGVSGQGTPSGPDLREEVPEMSDQELREVIREGEDSMPGFSFSSPDLTHLITYLREQFGAYEEEEEDD